MMDLYLQVASPSGGDPKPVAGKQEQGSGAADFARLLARHCGPTAEPARDHDPAPAKGRSGDSADPATKESAVQDRENRIKPGSERDSGKASPADRSVTGATGIPASGPALGEVGLPLAALPSFLSAVGPLGNLHYADPSAAGMENISPEVRARLAAEIAAGFTERNGVQTITLQLDPEQLGKVDVRLRAEGDRLSVRMVAANREAESALRNSIKELTDAIRDKSGRYQQVEIRIELKPQEESGTAGHRRGGGEGESERRDGGDPRDHRGQDGERPPTGDDDQHTTSGQRATGG